MTNEDVNNKLTMRRRRRTSCLYDYAVVAQFQLLMLVIWTTTSSSATRLLSNNTTNTTSAVPADAVLLLEEEEDHYYDGSSNTLFESDRRVVVTNQAMGARCAVAADFDGDGRLDLVSASSNDNAVSWYHNQGPTASSATATDTGSQYYPQFSIKRKITWESLGSRIVTVADINGDGKIDVVGASYYDSSLRWYENNLDGHNSDTKEEFIPHLISASVNEGQGVTVADIDNNGTPDVISASSGDNTIAIFRNLDGNGTFCEIKEVVDDQAIGARTVVAADLNGDGWIDLASASKDDDTVAWYPNDGTGHFPTKHIISSGNESKGAYSLVAADIDQDGHTDLVVASNGNDHVSLWRNDLHGSTGNFTKTLIYGNADFVLSVTAMDFDKDGDLDVASASFFDGHINWYENVDGKGYEWKNHTIYVGLQGHYVSTGDMDGDGDDDLIAVTHAENTVAIYFAQTECDDSGNNNHSNGTAAEYCCSIGTQWNGTACEACPHGTYGTTTTRGGDEGRRTTSICSDCPEKECIIPGLNVIPATCSGITTTGCANVQANLAQCSCETNTMKDPKTGVCTVCPEGQIRPDDPNTIRNVDSLGNYSIWESQQGSCYVPETQDSNDNSTTIIVTVGLVMVVVVFVLATIGLIWRRQKELAKSVALYTIDPNDIEYDDPIQVIGRGAFGEVVKGRYRGTEVAVKRVIPPSRERRRRSRSRSFMSSTVGRINAQVFGVGTYNARLGPSAILQQSKMSEVSDSSDDPEAVTAVPSTSMLENISPDDDVEEDVEEEEEVSFGLQSLAKSRSSSSLGLGSFSRDRVVTQRAAGVYRKMRADFITEMRQLSRLRHPNITTTMGAVLDPGTEPLLVMEYMHNGSLYNAIRNDSINLNSREDILTIIQDVARGLRFLHTAKPQVIHGDLKAKNVLIDSNFRAKVADFGLSAKASSGCARGTPYWMAPELLMEENTNNAMSDIYAFGILLYEVYSRQNPYAGEDCSRVLREVCDPAVSKRPPVPGLCPANIAALYKDCVEGDPEARPTAQDIDSKLQAEGTIQGRVFRIEALNRELAENNRRINSEQATQLAHFASMSHEIRTPLNCIIGISSLLEEDKNLDASQVDLVQMIVSSGRLLRHVVDDVLDFSKFISGNAEIDIKRTDLQETLRNIIASMELSPVTKRKQISLHTFYDPDVPQHIETDERRLQQILYNLLSNAVKFSKEESTIELAVSVLGGATSAGGGGGGKDEESLVSKKNGKRLCISVKDYGKGIAESAFEKIFQPFVQTETGIKNVDGGTGLGLAITKQLTELLGGSISVDSKLGEWAKFSLHFPLTGIPVDTKFIISRLSKCCIWLVSDSDWEIQWAVEACRHFNVTCLPFTSLAALANCLAPFGTDSFIVYLVQEDLYDDASYDALSKKAKSILLTFGPNGKIGRSQVHYHSLMQVFPSALMQQLIKFCDDKTPSTTTQLETASKGTEASHSVSYEKLKVLIADDNPVNQKVLSRLLERLGISNIQIASNGQVAVDLESRESFDIIFMDIQMPVMNGTEACKRIAARYKASDDAHERTSVKPKIVFLSAHVLDDYKAMCIEHGATDYMTKPCTLQDLRNKLAKLTGSRMEHLSVESKPIPLHLMKHRKS